MFKQSLKRGIDILGASLLLILSLPLCLIVVALILLIDHQYPIFIQKRLTKDRKEFNLYKFQSMTAGNEEDYGLTLEQDPRVTKVGKFIRRFRIDELPQLINIIKGDMSLVGPRPERPHIAAEIEKELPEFAERLQVKAGLTGYAQVHGTYGTPSKEKLEMDMYYIDHWSLWLDIKIIFQTIGVIFDKQSSKGVEVEK